jgi:hypothetical protein
VIPSTYTYIPKYSFGTNNGDGRDWQAWSFNGSNIYDWSNTYVNKYLKEQFKIQTYPGGYWCGQCLQMGIFNHDPQKGFESEDRITSGLDANPQNQMNGITYDVSLLWDSTGYTYTISHSGIIDNTGHTDIANINENTWVGWDSSSNNFQNFPSGDWYGIVPFSSLNLTGGGSMILQPYLVYDPSQVDPDPISLPEPDPISDPIPDPVLDTTPPSITSYTFNGTAGNITINPTVSSPLSLVFNASENVDWVSIKIEKEDDHTFHKFFYSGNGCVDGTNTCSKSWDGKLEGGLQNGIYKIKLHIKDLAGNDYNDYLSPYVITVDTSI